MTGSIARVNACMLICACVFVCACVVACHGDVRRTPGDARQADCSRTAPGDPACQSPAPGNVPATDADDATNGDAGPVNVDTDAALAVHGPATAVYTFRKPDKCGPYNRKWGQRLTRCETERQIELTIHQDGSVSIRPLDDAAPRNPYPFELDRQWRYCPFKRVAALDRAPEHFAWYEDVYVGGCYVHRDLPASEVDAIRSQARFVMLDRLHPWLADATMRMILQARREGIDAKVISGIRGYTAGTKVKTIKTKKDGKTVKIKKRVKIRKNTLHTFGLAVDINLSHRRDLGSASRAYVNDPVERKAWERLGQLGGEYGLIWLGPISPGEIFHFEWHSGVSGLMGGPVRSRAIGLREKGGLPAVWKMLKYDPAAQTSMKHLKD